jgi:hypothetical protein
MLANEIERMACAIMDKGECYKEPIALAVRFTVSPSLGGWRSNASGFDLYFA